MVDPKLPLYFIWFGSCYSFHHTMFCYSTFQSAKNILPTIHCKMLPQTNILTAWWCWNKHTGKRPSHFVSHCTLFNETREWYFKSIGKQPSHFVLQFTPFNGTHECCIKSTGKVPSAFRLTLRHIQWNNGNCYLLFGVFRADVVGVIWYVSVEENSVCAWVECCLSEKYDLLLNDALLVVSFVYGSNILHGSIMLWCIIFKIINIVKIKNIFVFACCLEIDGLEDFVFICCALNAHRYAASCRKKSTINSLSHKWIK